MSGSIIDRRLEPSRQSGAQGKFDGLLPSRSENPSSRVKPMRRLDFACDAAKLVSELGGEVDDAAGTGKKVRLSAGAETDMR